MAREGVPGIVASLRSSSGLVGVRREDLQVLVVRVDAVALLAGRFL